MEAGAASDQVRVVAQVATRLLRPGGRVCAEHAEVQSESAVEVFSRAGGFVRIADHRDLNDRPRFVTARAAVALAHAAPPRRRED